MLAAWSKACLALVVVAVMLAWPVAASAVLPAGGSNVDAPGLVAGPLITDAGLVWKSSRAIMLTRPGGRTTVLARADRPNWDRLVDLAWFGSDRWALARASGVFAGRVDGRLNELGPLSRCNPATPSATSAGMLTQYAVSGAHLYAALSSRCFARGSQPRGAVVDVDLRSRRAHVLSPLPGTLAYMAAAGRYLALAYWPSPPQSTARVPATPQTQPLLVRVLNAATGALNNQVTPPPSTSGFTWDRASGIQVDIYGDVLVTVGCCAAPSGRLAHASVPFRERPRWWWARARGTIGRQTQLGSDASLSAGRVAFLSDDPFNGEATIDLRDLLTGTMRTIVAFSGSVSAQGLALRGNGLAWAQQSSVINVVHGPSPGGGSFYSCIPVPLSPVELASLDLGHRRRTRILVHGAPIPPQYANEPPCVVR
jgi:hypothetical protein